MNMEPLVPALPSTNEYEDAATDNGRMGPRSHTHMHTPMCTEEAQAHARPSDGKR